MRRRHVFSAKLCDEEEARAVISSAFEQMSLPAGNRLKLLEPATRSTDPVRRTEPARDNSRQLTSPPNQTH